IYSPSGSSAGIGFAIPVDEVNRVVPQLIRHGKVTRPGLGIQVAADQLAKKLGVKGVLLVRALPGSPAEKAGLRSTKRDETGEVVLGDVIVAVDRKPVRKVNDLFSLLEKYNVGDEVTLDVVRDGQTVKVTASLGPVD